MKRLAMLLLLAGALGGGGWYFRDAILRQAARTGIVPASAGKALPKPDAARYARLKTAAAAWREERLVRYQACRSDDERSAVLAECRLYLEDLLPQMMRCWAGTPWDFNGTAAGPGEGKIACGYFVATVLKDAGFRVDRYKLAQECSQNILMTFVAKKDVKIQAGVPYSSYAATLRSAGPGIRIVGLDHHVGFLVTGGGSFRFIHSSGLDPWCVVDEGEDDARSLAMSNYRVQGVLTADRQTLLQWLKGEPFKVKLSGKAGQS